MARFGGYSQFGGGAQFGGGEGTSALYHRILRSLLPPGVYSEELDTLIDSRIRTYAKGLGDHGQVPVDRLALEIFPRFAEENLPEWEALFGLCPTPGATIAERQSACYSRWQGAQPSTLQALRMMVCELLNCYWAFWDRLDDSDVGFRFVQRPGNGTIAESTTELRLSVAAAVHGDWSETEDDCPRVTLPLVDRTDDLWWYGQLSALVANDEQGGGLCLLADAENAVALEVYRTSGANRIRTWVLEGGVVTYHSAVAAPSLPCWLCLAKTGGNFVGYYGATWDGLSQLGLAFPANFTPRAAGVYTRNFVPGYPASQTDFDDIKAHYGRLWNNVEIIETPSEIVFSDFAEAIFLAFVHAETMQRGSYNLTEAQRVLNRAKQAHTLILVGESDCFRVDDARSLTDRDVLGS